MASSQSDRPPDFHVKRALDLLGYPADAKLLIIHADDAGDVPLRQRRNFQSSR